MRNFIILCIVLISSLRCLATQPPRDFKECESAVIKYVQETSFDEAREIPQDHVDLIKDYISGLGILEPECRMRQAELSEVLRVSQASISVCCSGKPSPLIYRQLQWYYNEVKCPLSDFKKNFYDGSDRVLKPEEMDEDLRSKAPVKCYLLPKATKTTRNITGYIDRLCSLSNVDTVSSILYRSSETIKRALQGDREACYSLYLHCRDYYRFNSTSPSLFDVVQNQKVEAKTPFLEGLTSWVKKWRKTSKDKEKSPLIKIN